MQISTCQRNKKNLCTLGEKKKIMDEAYLMPRNFNKTSIKRYLHRSNIIRWKDTFTKNEHTSSRKSKKNKSFTAGRKEKHDKILTDLKGFYVHHRENRLPVSIYLLITKFKQLCRVQNGMGINPTRVAVTHSIRRWMKRSKMSLRRVVNKAQNDAHNVNVMNDFVPYENSINKIYLCL